MAYGLKACSCHPLSQATTGPVPCDCAWGSAVWTPEHISATLRIVLWLLQMMVVGTEQDLFFLATLDGGSRL